MDMITLAMAKAYSDSKGGYTEPAKTVFQMELTEGQGVVAAKNPFVAGQIYSVDIDGTVYIREAKKVIAPDGVSECVLIGNTGGLGGEDNGDPFMILAAVEDGTEFVQVWDNNGGIHVTVSTPETIVPICPKYLPESFGSGLPKVTLTTIATVDYPDLSAEECAAIAEAMKNGVFILECTAQLEGWEFILCGIPVELREAVSESFAMYELRQFTGDGDIIVQVGVEGDGEGNFTGWASVEFVDTSAT